MLSAKLGSTSPAQSGSGGRRRRARSAVPRRRSYKTRGGVWTCGHQQGGAAKALSNAARSAWGISVMLPDRVWRGHDGQGTDDPGRHLSTVSPRPPPYGKTQSATWGPPPGPAAVMR
jgi:hypothetical protein